MILGFLRTVFLVGHYMRSLYMQIYCFFSKQASVRKYIFIFVKQRRKNMLRKIRLTLAVILTTAITLVFLDITGTFQLWSGWIAKLQFLPAVLALNVAVVVALIALTLLLGRIYCSVICPLGVFQDVVAWF